MRTLASTLVPLLLAPLAAQEPVDFTKEIAPILIERCIECHGPDEQEGDLRLDSKEFVFAEGDEDWWTVFPKDPENSELLRRIGLGLDDDEIMPAKGEPLSKAQQQLIRRWIAEGASWPKAGDEHIAAELAAQVLPKITFELPALDDAGRAKIAAAVAALREKGAVVQAVAADTEAVEVNLSLLRDKVTDAELEALAPLAPVLVWLNIGRTAVTDAGGRHLAALTQLRRLNAANTRLSDDAFRALEGLEHLEYLNAYGTALGDAGLRALAGLPKLKQLYAWQSEVTAAGAAAARERAPALQVDLGDYVEERLRAAEQEIEAREERNKPVNDVCVVSGEPIDPAHFSIHDGKRVAFCCEKCKAKFDEDPAKFAGKLGGEPAPDEEAKEEGAKPPINDKCPVSGEAVDPAHTSMHDGKRVAFCCAKCKAKFDADPSKFASKLPGGK